MPRGAPGGDELVAHAAREGQVCEPVAVEVPELAPAETELDPAEAVRLDGDARPREHDALDLLGDPHVWTNARAVPAMPGAAIWDDGVEGVSVPRGGG